MVFGEAVVVLNPDAVSGIKYLRKLNMQLASKMRFVSAQLIALYGSDLWYRSAAQANRMATRLGEKIEANPQVHLTQPTQANAVLAVIPPRAAKKLRSRYRFYDWDPARGEVRWMTAFDTTETDVDRFAEAITAALND